MLTMWAARSQVRATLWGMACRIRTSTRPGPAVDRRH